MLFNLSALNSSGTLVSVGQYNQATQTLELWVYATRFVKEHAGEDVTEYAMIPDFDITMARYAKKVTFEDIDWDYRYDMTMAQFKKIPVKDGFRKIDMTKLTKY